MQSPQKFKYFYAINCWKVNPLMDAVNIVIIPNELLLFSDHYNLQVFQSLFRMVFCSKNLFLGNQNFEESQFENNKQLNKKIYLRLLYLVYGKKINSNSILQNLKFLKLTPFWTHFITRSCRWLRKLKEISSTTSRQRSSMCNREFDPGLIDRWWYPSNKLYNLHTV